MDFKFKLHINKYFVLIIVILFLLNGVVENIIITHKINSFKSNAVLVNSDTENGIKFYLVSRETSKPSLNMVDGAYYVGNKGDIIVKRGSPYPEIPVFHQLMTFFIGGHASYVVDSQTLIEVNGKDLSNNKVDYYNNEWFSKSECIGVRLKNQEIVDEVTENIKTKIGSRYNYTFIFDNGYYCTDLMSKSVTEVSKFDNINDCMFTTTNDIITSRNVEICYYHYTDNNGIKHVYYVN